jgi:hypothetical protein
MSWLVDRRSGSAAGRLALGTDREGDVTVARVDPRYGRAVEDVARATRARDLNAACAGAAAAAAAPAGTGRGARRLATAADHDVARLVVDQPGETVGRVVWKGNPTGVAVTWAMHHGGPYPATTDPLQTSVGAAAIRRWLRPISYRKVADELLPVELRDGDAPAPRRIDANLVPPASPGTPAAVS